MSAALTASRPAPTSQRAWPRRWAATRQATEAQAGAAASSSALENTAVSAIELGQARAQERRDAGGARGRRRPARASVVPATSASAASAPSTRIPTCPPVTASLYSATRSGGRSSQ